MLDQSQSIKITIKLTQQPESHKDKSALNFKLSSKQLCFSLSFDKCAKILAPKVDLFIQMALFEGRHT